MNDRFCTAARFADVGQGWKWQAGIKCSWSCGEVTGGTARTVLSCREYMIVSRGFNLYGNHCLTAWAEDGNEWNILQIRVGGVVSREETETITTTQYRSRRERCREADAGSDVRVVSLDAGVSVNTVDVRNFQGVGNV